MDFNKSIHIIELEGISCIETFSHFIIEVNLIIERMINEKIIGDFINICDHSCSCNKLWLQ
jgi:hypothetical protein